MPVTRIIVEESETDEVSEYARLWWLVALLGVISLVAGIIFVAQPSHSLNTLAVVFGIFLLIDGIVELVSAFGREAGDRAVAVILGVLGIVVGLILMRHPTHAVNAIGLVIGIWLVAAGIVRMFAAFAEPDHRAARVAIAALEIVVGVIVVSDPHIGYATLAVIVGIWLILNGAAMLALGYLLHGARGRAG